MGKGNKARKDQGKSDLAGGNRAEQPRWWGRESPRPLRPKRWLQVLALLLFLGWLAFLLATVLNGV